MCFLLISSYLCIGIIENILLIMKKFIVALLLLTAGLLPAMADNITVDGTSRSYIVYAPKNLSENRPLFIFCHGSGQDANYMLNTQFRDTQNPERKISIENVCDTAKPYQAVLTGAAKGKHTLKAVATDNDGETSTADVEYGDCILGQLILTASSYDVTGIVSMAHGKMIIDKDCVYDLQGRQVLNPQHGIYIKNGKKIFVK